ncbi:MAG: helix-turn-helix transcriptional regulator [Lachnospiraceae bacterium]|nr:helix-turn-helix transcriptional regulator [Lachnospiraceae bacterium]
MPNIFDSPLSDDQEYTDSFPLVPAPGQALLALVCSGSGSFYRQGIISEYEAGDCFFLYCRENFGILESTDAAGAFTVHSSFNAANHSAAYPRPDAATPSAAYSLSGAANHSAAYPRPDAVNRSAAYSPSDKPDIPAITISPETSCRFSLLAFALTDVCPPSQGSFRSDAVCRLFHEDASFCHLKLLPKHLDTLLSYQKLCLSAQKDSLTDSMLIYRQTLHALLLYFARTLAVLKPEKRQDSREFFSRSILTEQVKYLVHQNYAESLSLSELAASVFTNPSYLSRVFKEETGILLSHYINRVRIQKARELLEDTEELIIDIAVACGYNYIPHFNRVFKELTGMTPGAYRKSRRKEY